MLRSQGATDEEIFSATQRTAADERNRARNFSKRPGKIYKVVGNPAGSEFDCSYSEKSKCGVESSKVISELTKALSAVTEQLAALKKYVDMLKTQGCHPVSYAPNRYRCKSCIEQNIRQCQHCLWWATND